MYDPREDKPDFRDGYGSDVGPEIQFPPMAYYDLIVYDLTPEQLYKVFNSGDRRQLKRVEDVEMALMFINDSLDADRFNSPLSDEWNVQDLLMKGYLLERIRFRILRDAWEPQFKPFPHDPLKYYDPDVSIYDLEEEDRVRMWVKVREHPHGNFATLHIHTPDDNNDNFWIKPIDEAKKFESPYFAEVAEEYIEHLENSEKYPQEYIDEVGGKMGKLLVEYTYLTRDQEQRDKINEVLNDS